MPEHGGEKLIPEGTHKPGHLYTVSRGKSGMIGVFKLETEMVNGSGKFERTDREVKESLDTAFRFMKANSKSISSSISVMTKDYLMHIQDLNGIGMTDQLTLAAFVALCSVALNKPTVSSLAILGNLSIGGTIMKVDDLANILQVCLGSGEKKILLPITSAVNMGSVPPELMGKFNLIFYQTPRDAVFKALGVE